MKQTASMKT